MTVLSSFKKLPRDGNELAIHRRFIQFTLRWVGASTNGKPLRVNSKSPNPFPIFLTTANFPSFWIWPNRHADGAAKRLPVV
jgi:hypothetical protein